VETIAAARGKSCPVFPLFWWKRRYLFFCSITS